MKKSFSIGLTGMLVASMMLIAQPAHAAEISIPDPGLRTCINQELGQPSDADISEAQAGAVRRLSCMSLDIGTLDGIENLRSLNYLRLENNPRLVSIEPLRPLTGLGTLEVYHAPLADIGAVSSLVNLIDLELLYTNVEDLTPIAELPQLMLLNAYENKISDLRPLAGVTSLTGLTVADNLIEDVSPIAGLSQLNYLTISNNDVSDISPLSGLSKMAYLAIDGNHIADISPLSSMTLLRNGIFRSQSVVLPAIAVGEDQPSVIIAPDGSQIMPTSATATFDAANHSWSYATEGTHVLSWDQSVRVGLFTTAFTGTLSQEAVQAATTAEVAGLVQRDLDFSSALSQPDGAWPSGTVELISDGAVIATASIGDDGRFVFTDVAPGTYSLALVSADAEGWTRVFGEELDVVGGDRIADALLLYRENVPDPMLIDEAHSLSPGETVVIEEAPADQLTVPLAPGSIYDTDAVTLGAVAPRYGSVALVAPDASHPHSRPQYTAAIEWPADAADVDRYTDTFTYRYTNVTGAEAESVVTVTITRPSVIFRVPDTHVRIPESWPTSYDLLGHLALEDVSLLSTELVSGEVDVASDSAGVELTSAHEWTGGELEHQASVRYTLENHAGLIGTITVPVVVEDDLGQSATLDYVVDVVPANESTQHPQDPTAASNGSTRGGDPTHLTRTGANALGLWCVALAGVVSGAVVLARRRFTGR